MLRLEAQGLGKTFGGPWLFRGIDLSIGQGECLALTGANGSGKSTLLQILWGFQRPTEGQVLLFRDNQALQREERPFAAAFSAPYLGVPDFLTGRQILTFHFAQRPGLVSVPQMLAEVGLQKVADGAFKHYSSGQKQRIRLALALFADVQAYFLDEPCTNLDQAGIELYHSLLQPRLADSLVIIASNWDEEMRFAQRHLPVKAGQA